MQTDIAGVKYINNDLTSKSGLIDYSNYSSGSIDFGNATIEGFFTENSYAVTTPIVIDGNGSNIEIDFALQASVNYHLKNFSQLNAINGVDGRWYTLRVLSNGDYTFSDAFVFPNGDARPEVSPSGAIDLYNIYPADGKLLATFALDYINYPDFPIFYSDSVSGILFKFSDYFDDSPVTYETSGQISDFALDSSERIYVVDPSRNIVYRLTGISGEVDATMNEKYYNDKTVDSDGVVGNFNSVAINGNKTFVSYYEETGNRLKLAESTSYFDYETSIIATNENNNFEYYSDIAVDDNDRIYVAYHDRTNEFDTAFSLTTTSGEVSTIDSSDNVGVYNSLYSSGNVIYVSYYNETSGDLRFAKSIDSGETWNIKNVETVPVSGSLDDHGRYASIGVSDLSTIYISYQNVDSGDLKFAKSIDSGETWIYETIDAPSSALVGYNTNISVNNDKVYIIYYDTTNLDLKLAYSLNSGDTWNVQRLEDTTISNNSITSENSNVYISYFATGNNLGFLKSVDDGVTWFSSATLDSSASVGSKSSIAVNDGNIYIGYLDDTNNNLKFAKSTNEGLSWEIQTIDNSTEVGDSPSIIYDGRNIAISYIDDGNNSLKLALSIDAGETWSNQTVADYSNIGGINSIGLNESDILISHRDGISQELNLAKVSYDTYLEPVGGNLRLIKNNIITLGSISSQFVDTDSSVGQYSSIAKTSTGVYGIAYYNSSLGDLKFAKSTDLTNWEIQTIDSTGIVGTYSSIDSFENKFYISYHDYSNGDLKFAMSTDEGETWTNQIIDDTDSSVGEYTDIYTDKINGNIYISYRNGNNGDLKFAKSTDGGDNWDIVVVDNSLTTLFTSITSNGNNIYIAYSNASQDDLKFAKSTDGGDNWDIKTLDSTNLTGRYTSIVAENDFVYISYTYSTGLDLRVAKSSNAGDTFTIQDVETSNNIGTYTSIAMDGENVFISYHDSTNGNLKLASSIDLGKTWTTQTIDVDDVVGQYTSLLLDDSKILISHWRQAGGVGANQDLKLTTVNYEKNTTNDIADAASGEIVGDYVSIDYDAPSIHMSYVNDQNEIKYIKSDNYGIEFSGSIVIDSGSIFQENDIAVENDKVYISYHDTSGGLKFAYSYNSGTTFDIVNVDLSDNNNGLFNSVANGNSSGEVYVSYSSSGELKLARSLTSGQTFNLYTVDNSVSGLYNSMVIYDDSKIKIAYYDDINSRIKVASSTNSGETFNLKTIKDSISVGWMDSALYNNDYRISYYDTSSNDLKVINGESIESTLGIFIDNSDNILLTGPDNISKFSDINGINGLSYRGENAKTNFENLRDIKIGTNGKIFATSSGVVHGMDDFDGTNHREYKGGGFNSIKEPRHIDIDELDNIYLADQRGKFLYISGLAEISGELSATEKIANVSVNDPYSIKYKNNLVYIGNGSTVYQVDSYSGGIINSLSGFTNITDLDLNNSEQLYILDNGANTLYRYDSINGENEISLNISDKFGNFELLNVYTGGTSEADTWPRVGSLSNGDLIYIYKRRNDLTSNYDIYSAKSSDFGETWNETLVSEGLSDSSEVLNLDITDDVILVAYYDSTNPDIYVAISTNSGETYIEKQVDGLNSVGTGIGVARDSSGQIFVAFNDTTTSELLMYRSSDNGETFSGTVLDNSAANYTDIKIDSNDVIYVAYKQESSDDVKFTKSTDGGATYSGVVNIVTAGDVGYNLSMEINSNDDIFIIYHDDTNNDLELASSFNGGISWNITRIDGGVAASENYGEQHAFNIDDLGNLQVFYRNQSDFSTIRYASSFDSGFTWETQDVDVVSDATTFEKYGSVAFVEDKVFLSIQKNSDEFFELLRGEKITQIKGLGIDVSENIYITDVGDSPTLYRFGNIENRSGQITYNGSNGNVFSQPSDVAFDSQNRIYLVDSDNGLLYRFDDMNGTNHIEYDGTSGTAFIEPISVAIDSSDKIYVTDRKTELLYRIDDMTGSGQLEYTAADFDFFQELNGITVDENNKIYIVDEGNNKLIRIDDIDGKGHIEYIGDNDPLVNPKKVKVDSANLIYVTNSGELTVISDLVNPSRQDITQNVFNPDAIDVSD